MARLIGKADEEFEEQVRDWLVEQGEIILASQGGKLGGEVLELPNLLHPENPLTPDIKKLDLDTEAISIVECKNFAQELFTVNEIDFLKKLAAAQPGMYPFGYAIRVKGELKETLPNGFIDGLFFNPAQGEVGVPVRIYTPQGVRLEVTAFPSETGGFGGYSFEGYKESVDLPLYRRRIADRVRKDGTKKYSEEALGGLPLILAVNIPCGFASIFLDIFGGVKGLQFIRETGESLGLARTVECGTVWWSRDGGRIERRNKHLAEVWLFEEGKFKAWLSPTEVRGEIH